MQDITSRIQNSGVHAIRDRLGQISGGRVLDVGTFQGHFIKALMKSLKDYNAFIGIDISEKDIKKAEEGFQNEPVAFNIMNAEELSFDDNSFDTVCISYSLHHLENVDAVLREMNRVLKNGGHLIMQEMISDDDQYDAKLTQILIHHLDARVDRMNGIPHFETFTRKQLKDIIGRLGMSRVEVYESMDSLKCLFCDKLEECLNLKSEENIKLGMGEIDDILQRAADLPIIDDIQHEAERLKERVKTGGYESASQLFFICMK